MLAAKSLKDLLDAFASSDPTPGGGSAAALLGALGASLFAMVAALPKTRTGTPEERAALDAARADILRARDSLVDLIDRDAQAYDLVVAAYRQPKSTDDEKTARTAAIQNALRVATEVPVETIRACHAVIRAATAVGEFGNRSAQSDLAVAAMTVGTAVQAALFNVETNIGSLKDLRFVESITGELKQLQEEMGKAGTQVYASAGIGDLFKKIAERLGTRHAHPDPKDPAQREMLAASVMQMLAVLGSPDARRALEALATSSDGGIAAKAKEHLAKFTERG
jgi:formiminotetrahydrofolate cyclodeaminase